VRVLAASRVELEELGPERTLLALELGTVVIDASPEQPGELAIRAGALEVVVLGTQFMVRREPAEVVHVAVREGRVRVRAASEERVLVAGQAATWQDGRVLLRAPSRLEASALQRTGTEPHAAPALRRPDARPPAPREGLPTLPPKGPAPLPPSPAPEPSLPATQPPRPAPPSDVPQVMRKHRPGMLLPKPPETAR
jgi:hypothetical protein